MQFKAILDLLKEAWNGDGFKSLKEAFGKNGIFNIKDSLKSFATSTAGIITIATAATAAAYKVNEYAQTKYTRAQEQLAKSSSTYENDKSELQNLNQELDETKSRISELQEMQANGTITLADEAELSNLQNANSELERQLLLKEELAEYDAQQVANDAKKASETPQSFYELISDKYGEIAGKASLLTGLGALPAIAQQFTKKSLFGKDTTVEGQFKKDMEDLTSYEEQLKEVEDKLDSNHNSKKLQQEQADLQDKINSTNSHNRNYRACSYYYIGCDLNGMYHYRCLEWQNSRYCY